MSNNEFNSGRRGLEGIINRLLAELAHDRERVRVKVERFGQEQKRRQLAADARLRRLRAEVVAAQHQAGSQKHRHHLD